MTVKMKLGDVLGALDSMAELSKLPMSFAVGLKVSKLLGQMIEEGRKFHERRNELLKTLGTPDEEKPNQFRFTPENGAEFAKQVTEASEIEVEFLGDLLKLPDDLIVKPEVVLGISKFLQQ